MDVRNQRKEIGLDENVSHYILVLLWCAEIGHVTHNGQPGVRHLIHKQICVNVLFIWHELRVTPDKAPLWLLALFPSSLLLPRRHFLVAHELTSSGDLSIYPTPPPPWNFMDGNPTPSHSFLIFIRFFFCPSILLLCSPSLCVVC